MGLWRVPEAEDEVSYWRIERMFEIQVANLILPDRFWVGEEGAGEYAGRPFIIGQSGCCEECGVRKLTCCCGRSGRGCCFPAARRYTWQRRKRAHYKRTQ